MKIAQLMLLAAAGTFAFTACDGGDKDTGETGETGCSGVETADTSDPCYFYSGDVFINTLNAPVCADTGGTWEYALEARGWTGDGRVFIRQTRDASTWGEQHDMLSVRQTDNGRSDYLEASLVSVATPSEVDETHTLYDCGMESGLTYWFQIDDLDGNPTDCGVYGHDVNFNGTQDAGDTSAVPQGCFEFSKR